MVEAGVQHSFSEIQLFWLINNPISFILFLPKILFITYQKKKTNIIFPEIQLFWLLLTLKVLFVIKKFLLLYGRSRSTT